MVLHIPSSPHSSLKLTPYWFSFSFSGCGQGWKYDGFTSVEYIVDCCVISHPTDSNITLKTYFYNILSDSEPFNHKEYQAVLTIPSCSINTQKHGQSLICPSSLKPSDLISFTDSQLYYCLVLLLLFGYFNSEIICVSFMELCRNTINFSVQTGN